MRASSKRLSIKGSYTDHTMNTHFIYGISPAAHRRYKCSRSFGTHFIPPSKLCTKLVKFANIIGCLWLWLIKQKAHRHNRELGNTLRWRWREGLGGLGDKCSVNRGIIRRDGGKFQHFIEAITTGAWSPFQCFTTHNEKADPLTANDSYLGVPCRSTLFAHV